MSTEDIQEQFSDAELRVEAVVSLSWVADFYALSEATEELFADFDIAAEEAGIKLSDEARELFDAEEWEGLAGWLFRSGYTGIFVQAAQPLLNKEGRFPSFSWGYYTTRWFYSPTVDEAVKSALRWGQNNWAAVRGAA